MHYAVRYNYKSVLLLMQIIYVILAALAPVAVALWYIYKKDSEKPEPAKWLWKAFCFGVLSVPFSFVFSRPLSSIFCADIAQYGVLTFTDAFTKAFMEAAIPEELAKLIVLWLLLRKNPHFDERFDGIVYAVCVGMGFAGLENVMYLFGGLADGSWVGTGIGRALLSIPGHFFFAVLMGYYYSLYYWGVDRSSKTKALILVAPVLAHGIFDGILFSLKVDEGLAMLLLVLFLYFFNKLRKVANNRLNGLMKQ